MTNPVYIRPSQLRRTWRITLRWLRLAWEAGHETEIISGAVCSL